MPVFCLSPQEGGFYRRFCEGGVGRRFRRGTGKRREFKETVVGGEEMGNFLRRGPYMGGCEMGGKVGAFEEVGCCFRVG